MTLQTAGTIRADGPRRGRQEWWSVSYQLFVRRRSNLDLRSKNGGISIEAAESAIEFRTANGGIKLVGHHQWERRDPQKLSGRSGRRCRRRGRGAPEMERISLSGVLNVRRNG